MFRDLKLKKWEQHLIVAGAILFAIALFLYLLNFGFITYLAGLDEVRNKQVVGILSSTGNEVKRQIEGESTFKSIRQNAQLYELDTIVTGPESGATVVLDDGGQIELAPNTMIRLAFTPSLTMGGIKRAPQIEVVTGNVTAAAESRPILVRSKGKTVTVKKNAQEKIQGAPSIAKIIPKAPPPPPPPPSPTPAPPIVVAIPLPSASPEAPTAQYLAIVRPKDRLPISIPNGSPKAETSVNLEWRARPENIEVFLKVSRKAPKDKKTKVVFEGPVKSKRGIGQHSFRVTEPGTYEWEIASSDPKAGTPKLVKGSSFSVLPKFEALSILEPLVGGKPFKTNMIRGKLLKQFNITLRWNPYPDAKSYRVSLLANSKSTQALQTRTVTQPEYLLNKDKVYSGRIYYKVEAELNSGFTVTAEPEPFVFNFLPPLLVMPQNKFVQSIKKFPPNKRNIIFTWQKTNFTDAYQFQISAEPTFKELLVNEKLSENFYVWKKLAPGTYFWRVQAFSQSLTSAMSAPNEFVLRQ